MTYVLSGKKKDMNTCKEALLMTNGAYEVHIENITLQKSGIFKYELKADISGSRDNIIKFIKKVNSNFKILNGDILELLKCMRKG